VTHREQCGYPLAATRADWAIGGCHGVAAAIKSRARPLFRQAARPRSLRRRLDAAQLCSFVPDCGRARHTPVFGTLPAIAPGEPSAGGHGDGTHVCMVRRGASRGKGVRRGGEPRALRRLSRGSAGGARIDGDPDHGPSTRTRPPLRRTPAAALRPSAVGPQLPARRPARFPGVGGPWALYAAARFAIMPRSSHFDSVRSVSSPRLRRLGTTVWQ
jgi:hypothetical protein